MRTIGCGLALAGALHAQAPLTLDVLHNGGAEATTTARGKHRGEPCYALDHWQLEDAAGFVAQADGWGGMRAPRGKAFVRAAKTTPGTLAQEVALPGDGKARSLLLSAWIQTGQDRDRVELTLSLLDGDGEVVATRSTGALGSTTWARVWLALGADARIAARARRARVTLTATHHDGKFLDAFADEIALWIVGPGMPRGLAGKSDAELVAAHDAGGAARLAALAALLAGNDRARGERLLTAALAASKDADARHELLALAALAGHRDAGKLLRTALAGSDDAERALALELLPSAGNVDWRQVAAELARGTAAGARGAGLRALVRDGSKESQRLLATLHDGSDDAGKLDVVRALAGRDTPLDDAYRTVLLPHLAPRAAADLRHAALAALAQWRDARLLAHVAELVPHEEQRGRRAAWLAWGARFDSAAAADVLVQLAGKDEPRADAALLALLPAMQSPSILTWAQKQGVRHAHPVVRLAAVRTLAARGTPADARALLALAGDPDPDVAATALAAAARCAAGEDLDAVLRALPAAPPAAAARALQALWQRATPAASVVEATLALAQNEQDGLRAAALACLGAAHAPADVLGRALSDRAWPVRAVAYRELAAVRTRASVEAIMARLPHESGASLRAATEALAALTGVAKGNDAGAWLAWWKLAAADFAIGAAARTPAPAADAGATVAARYHGVPIDGARVVFVLDLSGSMRDDLRDRKVSKLRAAQDELTAALRRLTPQQAFAIVGFADGEQAFAEQPVPATPGHVADACAWVERLQAKGWTNLWAGLARALALPDADTIFLLSDGAPSVGRFVDAPLIAAEVRARDVARVVRIHAIVLDGDRHDRAFLQALAADSGGTCVEAK